MKLYQVSCIGQDSAYPQNTVAANDITGAVNAYLATFSSENRPPNSTYMLVTVSTSTIVLLNSDGTTGIVKEI